MPRYDLSVIPSNNTTNDMALLIKMAQLGYDGIVWNRITDKVPSSQSSKDIAPYRVLFPTDDNNGIDILHQNTTKNNFFTGKFSPINEYYTDTTPAQTDIDSQQLNKSNNNTNTNTDSTTTTTTSELPSTSITPLSKPLVTLPSSFQQLTRLTLRIDEMNVAQNVSIEKNKHLQSYDIIAVTPGNDKVLHYFLMNDECDIISFDLSKRLPFLLKPQHVRMAIEKNIFYELDINPLFTSNDPNVRRICLTQLQQFFFITRGKQLVLTTSCGDIINSKSLLDLQQLLVAFGAPLREIGSYSNENIYHVIQHARTRRVHKAVIAVSLSHKTKTNVEFNNSSKANNSFGNDKRGGDGRGNSKNYDKNDQANTNNKKQRFNK